MIDWEYVEKIRKYVKERKELLRGGRAMVRFVKLEKRKEFLELLKMEESAIKGMEEFLIEVENG